MPFFEERYRHFVANKNQFFDVLSANPAIKNHSSKMRTLLILDSSFNPPHRGHMTMVTRAAKRYTKNSEKTSLLLQLSVNNVDKKMKPALPSRRLEMMDLFAKDISRTEKIDTYIALTKHGKFSDKVGPIAEHFREQFSGQKQYVFLLGFDTLERLFMPKYYLPATVEEALLPFFENCTIYCLTRGSDFEAQIRWVSQNVPSVFQKKIDLEVNEEPETSTISSSGIRENKDYQKCTESVEKYITKSGTELFEQRC